MKRRTFIKNSTFASGMLFTLPLLNSEKMKTETDFLLLDLHVHTTAEFTMENIMDIGERAGVRFGIVEHPVSWVLKDEILCVFC